MPLPKFSSPMDKTFSKEISDAKLQFERIKEPGKGLECMIPANGLMTNILRTSFALLFLLFLIVACNKDDDKPATTTLDFPKNTAWTGTFNYTQFGTQYPQPCCIKFRSDNSIMMYGVIYASYGGALRQYDSLKAIIKGTENTDAGMKVDLEFELTKENTSIVIANQKTLTTAGQGSFSFNLELFDKEVVLPGTSWSGHVMHGGPLEGLHAYPDLSTVYFYLVNKVPMTGHMRGGSILYNKPYGDQEPIQSALFQHGSIVYLDGFNEFEGIGVYVPYFGVLIGDGDKMLVEARDPTFARLPSNLATIDWYGPKGMTPVLHKN